jgi:uncharacterized protein (DUF1501 family)
MRTRREFLKQSAIVSLAPTIPAFLKSASFANQADDGKILVVVQLDGGNDGLNTVVPFQDDNYHALRSELRLQPSSLIQLNDSVGLHSSMQGMANLFEAGRLAVVQGVGYPEPNRSHDVSMAIWQTARLDPETHRDVGWLGRSLDRGHSRPQVPDAVATVADETPQALRGRKCRVASIRSLDEFRSAELFRSNETASIPTQPANGTTLAQFMRQSELEAQLTVDQIRALSSRDTRSTSTSLSRLGNSLARQLSVIADLISAEFGPRVYYASQSGYDTHSNQLATHGELLGTLSSSLEAFLKDLEASGQADRVIVLCFSEFGRQVQENASSGTDHGTAGPVFLLGKRVHGGVHGKSPDLGNLIDNAPLYTTDFRDVYAGILRDWLQIDPLKVLDGHANALDLIVG